MHSNNTILWGLLLLFPLVWAQTDEVSAEIATSTFASLPINPRFASYSYEYLFGFSFLPHSFLFLARFIISFSLLYNAYVLFVSIVFFNSRYDTFKIWGNALCGWGHTQSTSVFLPVNGEY